MLLEIKGLRKTFDDGTRALQGVDISVKLGEFVVILGSSGSGKTTLLRSINGLVNPEAGEVKFFDRVISSATLPDLRKETGMVFQDFNLVNNLSSLNNVLTGLLDSSNSFMSMLYLFSREQKIQALKCLEMVGLLDKAYSRVDKLSGAPVRAFDLRAGAAVVLAGLIAEGTTEISDIFHIQRGYSDFEKKLRGLGADIRKID